MEIKKLACSRLGPMLHLDTQNGKESMKMSDLQKYLIGTSACTRILTISTKRCRKLTSNDTYFEDIWFSRVKPVEEAMDAGVDYCGSAKMSHKGFCLSTLEKLIKY